MDHATFRQLTAGAVLDDLDPAERTALDRHLATCRDCRMLTGQLDDALADLALLVPEVAPPPTLLTDVLTALREPVSLDAAGAGAVSLRARPAWSSPDQLARPALVPVPGSARTTVPPSSLAPARFAPLRASRPAWLASVALAAGLGIVAVGLGARTIQLSDDLAAARAAVVAAESREATRSAAMAVVADPAHVTAGMHAEPLAPAAESVVVFRPGTDEAFLMATDLPPTPRGQVYQLWYADAAGVHALGTFHHDGLGPFVAAFDVDLTSSTAAMVTLEPEGGATGEPGPQVIFGEL